MDIEKFLKIFWNIFWIVFIIVVIGWYLQNRDYFYPQKGGILDQFLKNISRELRF